VDGRGLKRILGNFDLECGREGVGGTRGANCKIPKPRRGLAGVCLQIVSTSPFNPQI
jgi:hypothetical protein